MSNQNRTDIVEQVDDYFLNLYSEVKIKKNAKINTESPAWALDRLSILQLKIYHMNEEASRTTSSIENRAVCLSKLKILMEQNTDLSLSIDQLLLEIGSGEKIMKVYKQMKMYNDVNLNPILYQEKSLTKDKHIIILRFSSLGDVAILIPLLRCIIDKYKNLKITIVTLGQYNALFNEFKDINIVNVEKDFQAQRFSRYIQTI